jgi:TP901 family phage tail tape measure protein
MNGFIDASKKLSNNLSSQNKVVKETIDEFKNLDGSITKTSKQILANGELIEKSRTKHDANKKSIQDESQAYEKQRKTLAELETTMNGYAKVSEKVNKNKSGQINSVTNTYKNADTGKTITVNTDANGYVNNSSKLTEYIKLQQSTLAQEQAINKQREQVYREEYSTRKALADKNLQEEEQRNQKYIAQLKQRYTEEQKIKNDNMAMDKTHTLALQQNSKRDLTYQKSLADMESKIADTRRRFGSDKNLVSNLDGLEQKLKGIKNIGDFKTQFGNINSQLKQITANAQTATNHTMSMGESFKSIFTRLPMYMISSTAIFAPFQAIKSGLKYIYELDTAMTSLKKVTDETNETYDSFLVNANNIANDIGGLTIDVIKSTAEWAKLGYTIRQAQTFAKETLIYQNVGEISSAEEASKSLISAMKGFGFEADTQGKNIAKIVDLYNEIGNKYAISSSGIGDALKRSAASMSEAGNSIEESVAIATAANSVIQDPARVGQFMKTASMRLRGTGIGEDGEDLGKVIPALEEKFNKLGLTLKKDENTFKSTFEIFQSLAGVWKDISDLDRASILEDVAGKMQGNIAASLLQNWDIAEKSLLTGLDSLGSATKENEKFLISLQGRVALFKNSVGNLWSDIINTDTVKGIVDIGTSLIGIFDKLVKSMGSMPAVTLLLVSTFGIFNSSVKGFIASTGTQMNSWLGVSQMQFLRTTVAVRQFATSLGLGAAASKAFAVSLMGLTRAFLPLAAITAVAWGIGKLTSAISKHHEESRKATELSFDQVQSLREQKKAISDLTAEMNELKKAESAGTITTEQKQKLFDIQAQLVEQYGVSADKINAEGQAYTDSIEAINERTAAIEKQIQVENEQNRSKLAAKDSDNSKSIKEAQKDIDDYQKRVNDTKDQIAKINKDISSSKISLNDKLTRDTIVDTYGDLSRSDNFFGERLKKYPITVKQLLERFYKEQSELEAKLAASNTSLQDPLQERTKVLAAATTDYINQLEDNGKKISDQQRSFVDAIVSTIATNGSGLLQQTDQIKKIVNSLNSGEIDTLTSKYAELKKSFEINPTDATNNQIVEIRNQIEALLNNLSTQGVPITKEYVQTLLAMYPVLDKNAVATKLYNDAVDKMKDSQDRLRDSYKGSSEEVKELNNIQSELNKGNSLNSETTNELIAKYPQLAKFATKAADGWTIEKDAVEKLKNEKIDFFKKDFEKEEENAKSVVNASIKKINAYGLQIGTITTLGQAKQALLDIDKKLDEPSQVPDFSKMLSSLPINMPDKIIAFANKIDGFVDNANKKAKEGLTTKRDAFAEAIAQWQEIVEMGKSLQEGLNDPKFGVSNTKDNDKTNESYTDTVEILTDLQKALAANIKSMDDLTGARSRMRKGSQEYRDSIAKENKLLEKQISLRKDGMADPSKLVSTKVTTTTKTRSSDSSDSSSGSGVSNMISAALGLVSKGDFKYAQVSGKFKGNYEEFVKGATSDCSQFVQELFKQYLAVDLPRTAAEQSKQGVAVSKSELKEGDIVYFNTTGASASHVGFYSGNGKFVQMGNSGLKESDLNSKYWADKYEGARRVATSSSPSLTSSSSGKTTIKNGNTTVKTDGATAKEMSDAIEAAIEANKKDTDSIYQNNLLILDSVKYKYERLIEAEEAKIEVSKKVQDTLDPNSAEWRKENNKQINIQSAIQKLKHVEKSNLQSMMKELKVNSDDYDDYLKQLSVDWLDIQSDKLSKVTVNLDSQLDNFDEQISLLGSDIDLSNAKLSNLNETSAEYRKELLSQIPILEEQQSLRKSEIAFIEKQLTNEKMLDVDKKKLSDRLRQLKIDWEANNKAIKEVTRSIMTLTNDALSSLFDTLKKSLNGDGLFDLDEFSDSIDSIIASLDEADKKFLTNVSFVDSSDSARNSLTDYSNKVKDIASQVKSALSYYQDMSTINFSNLSSLGNQINSQVALVAKLKTQLEEINNTIRDTETQYAKEEAALQNNIKTQEKYYDAQIKAQQEVLSNLDEEISKEDRIASLKEINDNLDKAKNDKRFSYITEAGEEILTFDKQKVDELEKQKDDLLKQYEREDVKKAIQDNIDTLQKEKDKTIEILNEKLDKTKAIHKAELEALKLYQSSLSSLYDKTVSDTQSKMDQFQAAIQKGLEDGSITAAQGSYLLESVVNNWQNSSLSSWDFYINSIKAKMNELKTLFAEMANLASQALSTPMTPDSTGSGTGSGWYDPGWKKDTGGSATTSDRLEEIREAAKGKRWDGKAWVYHTGGEVGKKPLGPNEVPAILEKGEHVFTEEQMGKLRKIISISSPTSFIKNLASGLQRSAPNIPVVNTASTSTTSSDTNYYLSNVTVNANNPMEFLRGIDTLITSRRK